MELRHLRYFLAVAEEGHVTRAAARLGLQQPPLSQQLRALEAELGVTLFRRLPRGMELTEAGKVFRSEAQSVLARLDQAVDATRHTARGEAGRLVVGFTGSAAFHPFVPAILRHFSEAAPRVQLSLEEGNSAELIEGLQHERIDAAFLRVVVGPVAGLAISLLLTEEMRVALPVGHKLASRAGGLPLKALAEERFIFYRRPTGPGLYDSIIAACRRAGFSPNVGQEAPRILSTLSLVAAGLGVTLVPESMSRVQTRGVIYRRLHGAPDLVAPLHLAIREGEPAGAVKRFVDLVRERAAKPTPSRS
ncbi:MAG TPA: LysR family transcriptional regulator [Dongiaceae bacterium]|jgi:DNA-binding transcriptional LysR family regulator